jgi:hypothetical protein
VLDGVHDFGRVDPGQFLPGGTSRLDQPGCVGAAGIFQAAAHRTQTIRALRMALAGEVGFARRVHLDENGARGHHV